MTKLVFKDILQKLESYLHKELPLADVDTYFEHLGWADERQLSQAISNIIGYWKAGYPPKIGDIKDALFEVMDRSPHATLEELGRGEHCYACDNTGWILMNHPDKQPDAKRCDQCERGKRMIQAIEEKRRHYTKRIRKDRDWTGEKTMEEGI